MFGQFGDRNYEWENGIFVYAFVFKNNFAGSRLENDVHVRVLFAPKLCALVFSWIYWYKKIFLLLGQYKTMSDSNICQPCMIKTGKTCGASTEHKGGLSYVEHEMGFIFSAELFFF